MRPVNRTHHKCAVCGRTDEESPGMEFRYCSKCEGSYEYCMDHLYTHQHVTEKIGFPQIGGLIPSLNRLSEAYKKTIKFQLNDTI